MQKKYAIALVGLVVTLTACGIAMFFLKNEKSEPKMLTGSYKNIRGETVE